MELSSLIRVQRRVCVSNHKLLYFIIIIKRHTMICILFFFVGIEFLREKGLLGADAASVVNWLRTNPQLDKKKIADYICSRKHADVS